MGRSLPLVVAAAVVLLLVLVLAPLLLAGMYIRNPKVNYHGGASTQRTNSIFRGIKRIWKHRDELTPPSGGQKTDEVKAAYTAGLFIFNLSVGTGAASPQNISGILDITTPLVWSQCAPCSDCLPPPAPTFQPDQSPTFAALPCGSDTCQSMLTQTCTANATETDQDYCVYTGVYGADTNTTGYLANDLVFGCSVASVGDFAGASGVFGFSRGPLSLVSQLQLSWFSYFLASDDDSQSGSSFFQFGGDDVKQTTTTTTTNSGSAATPLLTGQLHPELCYVNLTGIRVGKDLVDIPAGTFGLRANGSGGVFLSTTMPVTFLEETAYDMVKQAFVKHFNDTAGVQPVDGSALGLDLCYNYNKIQSNVAVPEMALVFDGEATMELKEYNYFFADDTSNGGTGLACLTMLPYQGVSLLGSLLQTGRTMTYDIGNAKSQQLIFETAAPAAAAAPAANSLLLMMFHHV
ncbi:aspartic proteinase nepenthesin-1-like [Miscanthus floridulus]|uniref:aspartic proteinase nepenthesin-1-like n=1 Tax=Miscanthus floridulus TaxID=154761 RepID=UPI0034573EDE